MPPLLIAGLLLESLLAPFPQAILAAPSGPAPLGMFAPLIGRSWTAEFPGGKATDHQQFEWVYGEKFVRNTHQVRSAEGGVVYEGETVYAWDARQQRIVWWYWNSTGGYVTGTAHRRDDGAIVSEGENSGPANQLDRTRLILRIGDGQWTSQGAQQRDGKWTEQPARTYRPAK